MLGERINLNIFEETNIFNRIHLRNNKEQNTFYCKNMNIFYMGSGQIDKSPMAEFEKAELPKARKT